MPTLKKQLPAYAEKMNEAQREALCHNKGPAMVLAGPGSGKTTVLTGRVRYLTEQLHIPPSSILVITYTKAAALSMQKRFFREMSGRVSPVVFGTFHAICYQILKEQYLLKQDCLLSEQEKIQIIKSLLKENKYKADTEEAEVLLGFISMRKNSLRQIEEGNGDRVKYASVTAGNQKHDRSRLPEGMEPALFDLLYHDYTARCIQLGKMDFDDMLLKCFWLFQEKEEVLIKWQSRFQYILVDEFQDCNDLQFGILKLLAGEAANLFVVGDDDQSIYGFRGANPGIMRQFTEEYPQGVIIRLEANYRSREAIVRAGNVVIAENKTRFAKTMYAVEKEKQENEEEPEENEEEPGGDRDNFPAVGRRKQILSPVTILSFPDKKAQNNYIFSRVKELSKQFSYEDMAVIFRTNREAELFTCGLEENNIPYSLKGNRKSEYVHFTALDMAAYLRAAELVTETGYKMPGIPRQILLRIVNKPERDITRDSLPEGNVNLLKSADKACLQLYKQLCRIAQMSPWAAISYVRKVIGYDKWLLKQSFGNREKYEEWKDILEFVHTEAKRCEKIHDWLLFVEARQNKPGEQTGEKGIRLMTMHAAKGLEYAYVCIPNVNEGTIPHGRLCSEQTAEEERRLFYVGMTRAKTALDILYLTGTEEYPKLPSRFLDPLLRLQTDTRI